MVGLDETHATHIGSQVKDPIATGGNLRAVVEDTKIDVVKLRTVLILLEVLILTPISNNTLTLTERKRTQE